MRRRDLAWQLAVPAGCLLLLALITLSDDNSEGVSAFVPSAQGTLVVDSEPPGSGESKDSSRETLFELETASAAAMTLQVIDPENHPVEGARVFARAVGGCRIIGRTSADGSILVPGTRGCREYLATHENFAPSSIAVECEFPRSPELSGEATPRLVIMLFPSTTIEGMVDIGGSIAPEGIRVAALPRSLAPRAHAQPWEELLNDPQVRLTETDPLGRFTLTVLPGDRYTILAGGQGLVQASELPEVPAGATGVTIQLRKGFLLSARFVEPSGGPVRLASSARIHSPSFTVIPAGDALELSSSAPLTGFFAGVPLNAQWREFREQDRICFQFVSDSADEFAGPIDVQGWLPGYAPFAATLWARAIGSGFIDEKIVLQRTAEGFGTIRIRLTGVPCPMPVVHGSSNPALFLHLLDTSHETIAYRLMEWVADTCFIRDVPTGQYSWSFVAIPGADMPAGNSKRGMQPTCVKQDAETEIVVDVSDRGVLALGVLGQDGRPYVGSITGTLSSPPEEIKDERTGDTMIVTRGVEYFRFWNPPYEISYLPPGEFSLRLTFPELTKLQAVRISAGKCESESVRLTSW